MIVGASPSGSVASFVAAFGIAPMPLKIGICNGDKGTDLFMERDGIRPR